MICAWGITYDVDVSFDLVKCDDGGCYEAAI